MSPLPHCILANQEAVTPTPGEGQGRGGSEVPRLPVGTQPGPEWEGSRSVGLQVEEEREVGEG